MDLARALSQKALQSPRSKKGTLLANFLGGQPHLFEYLWVFESTHEFLESMNHYTNPGVRACSFCKGPWDVIVFEEQESAVAKAMPVLEKVLAEVGSLSMARAQFLNVDLDLHDEAGVAALVRKLEPQVFVLHEEDRFASLELAAGTTPPLDQVLNALVDVVEALPRRARTLWNRCQRRRMNVGIEAGDEHPATGFVIPLPTLERLVSIGAELELTVYALSPGRKRFSRTGSRSVGKSRAWKRSPGNAGQRSA